MRHRFLARFGTVTGLIVVLHACGGDDRTFGTEATGGDDGSGGGGKSSGGGGGKSSAGSKSTGGSAGKASGGGDPGGNDAGGNGATGGDTGGVDAGGSGGVNAGGSGNEAGAGGDGIVVEPGRPGSALVSGGNVMTSAKYRLVLTTGEGPGGTQVLESTNYRLLGGLVGTTEH